MDYLINLLVHHIEQIDCMAISPILTENKLFAESAIELTCL